MLFYHYSHHRLEERHIQTVLMPTRMIVASCPTFRSVIVIPADLQRGMTHCGQANLVDIDRIANELENANDSNEITVDFEFDNSLHSQFRYSEMHSTNLLCYHVVVITETKENIKPSQIPHVG